MIMKLSDIHHKIDEGKRMVEIDGVGIKRKTWVFENPSHQSIVDAIDLVGETLGGWTGPQGTWVWDRFRIDHFSVAKAMGIDRTKMIPFYIKVEEKNPDGSAAEVNFETSEFSGVKSIDVLMSQQIIIGVMRILAKRKEESGVEVQDDYSDLIGSLSASDY